MCFVCSEDLIHLISGLIMVDDPGGNVEEIDRDVVRASNQPPKTSESSSSSSSSSTSSSSTSVAPTFELDGVQYPSYQAMVEAKRERNRMRLVQTTSAVSAVFDESKSTGSKSQFSSKGSQNKRKSKSSTWASNDDATMMTPLRRSSRLCAGMKSYKENRNSDEGSETERPLLKRMKLGKSAAKPVSSTSMNSSVREKGGKIVENTKQREVVIKGGVIRPPSAPFSLFKHVARMYSIKRRISKTQNLSKVSLVPHSIFVDMSHTLDHILMSGYRVRQRDMMLKEFQNKENYTARKIRCIVGGGIESDQMSQENQKNGYPSTSSKTLQASSINYEDVKLYQPIMDAFVAPMRAEYSLNNRDRPHDSNEYQSSGICDNFDEDIEIPAEFVLSSEKNCNHFPDRKYVAVETNSLPYNDSVRYNNVVLNRHNEYLAVGVDREWDKEYGDGIDPMMFTEERRRFILDQSDESIHRNDSETETVEERNYTSLLIQRCWDRAVHTASSSLAVNPTVTEDLHGDGTGVKANAEFPLDKTVIEKEGNNSNARQRSEAVASNLHNEVLRVVDGLLDVLLAEGGRIRKMIDAISHNEVEVPGVDWKDILECIKEAAADEETSINRIKIPNASLESMSMRLIERYSDNSSKIPP